MVDDSENTIVRPRRAPRVAAVSDVDALADTVLAPPPSLIEPSEVPPPPRPLPMAAPAPTSAPVFLSGDAGAPLVPPPSLGNRIRVGDSVFSLEAPAFVGRHPSTPRVLGSRAVRLVRVPSPNREVSATHASFREEGGSVVVTDLGSTNGTVVESRGATQVLRGGDSVVVLPGGRVLLGDSVVVEVVDASVTDD